MPDEPQFRQGVQAACRFKEPDHNKYCGRQHIQSQSQTAGFPYNQHKGSTLQTSCYKTCLDPHRIQGHCYKATTGLFWHACDQVRDKPVFTLCLVLVIIIAIISYIYIFKGQIKDDLSKVYIQWVGSTVSTMGEIIFKQYNQFTNAYFFYSHTVFLLNPNV